MRGGEDVRGVGEAEQRGRQTGSVEWRQARGELGTEAEAAEGGPGDA